MRAAEDIAEGLMGVLGKRRSKGRFLNKWRGFGDVVVGMEG